MEPSNPPTTPKPDAPTKSPATTVPFIHPLFCFQGKEAGVVVAMRHDGDELLFFGRNMTPARWVPVGQVVPDPKGISPLDPPRHEEED